MKDEWLFPNAVVPVDTQTTLALLVEIKRLIDVQNMASESTYKEALAQPAQEPIICKARQQCLSGLPCVCVAPALQRTWVGLDEKDFSAINQSCLTKLQAATSAESILKEKNNG